MKRFTLFFGLLIIAILINAQVPQGFKYQTVARNNSGEILANQNISFRMTILQGALPGTVVYEENHLATTNASGLATLEIGRGTPVSGSFSAMNWSTTPIFLKTEIDPAGGSVFVEMGTSELLSVPFALYAQNVAGGAPPANLLPPVVTTEAATNVQSNSATFNGIVNGKGFSSTVAFQYGTTANEYGYSIAAIQSPVTGSLDLNVTAEITGLQSATTYHYRTIASNAVNVSFGSDMSFTTIAGLPVLTTTFVYSIMALSAVSGGNISYDGGAPVTSRGVCWSTNQNPTLSDSFTLDGEGTGSFTSNITGLIQATKYYVRAYATNAGGTAYGYQTDFTTKNGVVLLSTNSITSILALSAVSGGNISNDGGATVTARGVCWSINQNPTLSDSFTTNDAGTGSFISNITGLVQATTYYVRAYATNAVGTYYGNQRNFTTHEGLICLTTANIAVITFTSATCGGDITDDGGEPVTARGVCWSLLPNPNLTDNFTFDGTGLGSFSSELTGLTVNATYYVRAYATNAVGTVYGDQQSFTSGIGAIYQGGIIAYILQSGDPGYIEGEVHGLITVISSETPEWGCYGTNITGADGTAIGTGNQNTIDIESGCAALGTAADICANLTLGGYSDWFLPSKDELNKLYINKAACNLNISSCWSSSEYSSDRAWRQDFNNGSQSSTYKTIGMNVLAVRSF